MAWKSDVPSDVMRGRLESLEKLDVETEYVTPELIRASLVFGKGWLEEMPDIMVNTLLNPIIMEYYRDAWKGE